MTSIFKLFLNIYIAIDMCEGAKILAVFPFTARSHFTMFEALLDELHARGHILTVLSHFPKKNRLQNYTDISLVGATRSLNANMSLSELSHFGLLENLRLLNQQIDDYEPIFQVRAVQDLLRSEQSFDLILTEIFNTDLFLVFFYKFKCPNIALSASPLMPWAYTRIGLSIQPSIMPHVFSDRVHPMNFVGMALNSVEWVTALFYYKYFMNPKSYKIARKYYDSIPSFEELSAKTSLILVNTHFSLHKQMSSSNKLIEVGGMHIREAKSLDESLETFLNESEHGVIVFSLGSMFRAETIPKHIFDIFLNVFSSLRQNILWKWESGTPPRIKNIKFMEWLPQRDVLAHPKVKLFIYHMGLLGTSEAIYCGVPMLGLPQFGDMPHNMAAVGDAGIKLSLMTLTESILRESIYKLINDPRYKEEAERLSVLYKDRPESPLSKAVYWVEYTIRHNGTKHIPQQPSDLHELIILTSLVITCLILLPVIVAFMTYSFIRPSETRREKVKDV